MGPFFDLKPGNQCPAYRVAPGGLLCELVSKPFYDLNLWESVVPRIGVRIGARLGMRIGVLGWGVFTTICMI